MAKAKEGHTVIVKDEKKGQEIIELKRKNTFNVKTFSKALQEASGVFAARNHPEWKIKKDVSTWLVKERKSSDRNF